MARRGLDKYIQKAAQQASADTPIDPTQPGDAPPTKRKKISSQTTFLLSGVILLAAAGVFALVYKQKEEIQKKEERKSKIIGETGRQSTDFNFPRAQ